MDDAWALDAADAGKTIAAMGQQRVDQRAVGIARRGMNHQPSRLVEHDHMLVLEPDDEVHRLRLRLVGDRRRQCDDEALARFDPHRGVRYRRAVQAYLAGLYETLQPRARQRRKTRGKQPVKSLARFPLFYGDGFHGSDHRPKLDPKLACAP